MIKKPHRIVEPAAPTGIIHESIDGKVIEKKNRKGEGFKSIFDQKMRKYDECKSC